MARSRIFYYSKLNNDLDLICYLLNQVMWTLGLIRKKKQLQNSSKISGESYEGLKQEVHTGIEGSGGFKS